MLPEKNYWQRRLSRRVFVERAAVLGAGIGAASLVACGSSNKKKNATSGSSSPAGSTVVVSSAPAAGGTATGFSGTGNAAVDKVLKAYPINPSARPGTAKKGGVLKVATSFSLATFDPAKGAAGATLTPCNCVYNRLVTFETGPQYDPDHPKIVADLAKTWEQPDPQTLIFHLTPGVKFHNKPPLNGRDLVADDIKYAYERYANTGANTALLQEMASVTSVDNRTVQIKLKQPFPDMIYRLASRYLTIFPHELVDTNTIDTQMVGTGPVMLAKVTPGQAISFDKNPDYFMGTPNLDGFELQFVEDVQTRTNLFRAGQVAYSFAVPGSAVDDATQLLSQVPSLFGMRGQPNNDNMVLMLNLDNPKYKDPRVRRALAMGLNHDVIGQTAFSAYYFGTQIPWSLVLDQPDGVSQMGQWFKYDLAEAKKLLEAAGSQNLEINAIDSQGSPGFTRVDDITVDQLRQIGVTLKIQMMEYNAMNAQYVPGKYPDAVMEAWRPPTLAPSDAFEQLYKTGAPGNRNHFSDPAIDKLIDQQKAETDAAKARQIRQQIRQKYLDDVWYIPHPVGLEFQAFQPSVHNIRLGALQDSVSWFYEWGPQLQRAWIDK